MEIINGEIRDPISNPESVVNHATDVALTEGQMDMAHRFTAVAIVTLPVITGSMIGKYYRLMKASAGDLTVNASGADTIVGDTSFVNDQAGDTDAVFCLVADALASWRPKDPPIGNWNGS